MKRRFCTMCEKKYPVNKMITNNCCCNCWGKRVRCKAAWEDRENENI